jgi:hypothetical protein
MSEGVGSETNISKIEAMLTADFVVPEFPELKEGELVSLRSMPQGPWRKV